MGEMPKSRSLLVSSVESWRHAWCPDIGASAAAERLRRSVGGRGWQVGSASAISEADKWGCTRLAILYHSDLFILFTKKNINKLYKIRNFRTPPLPSLPTKTPFAEQANLTTPQFPPIPNFAAAQAQRAAGFSQLADCRGAASCSRTFLAPSTAPVTRGKSWSGE